MSLTLYPKGSIREILKISLPLMLSSLSVLMMFFVDRILLANYSIDAFNAAVTASTLGWAFIFGGLTIATIAEVFVAQHNGAGEYHKLGIPVWQMIWFGIFTCVLFIPLSIWGPHFFYGYGPDRLLERQYFTWMVLFGPTYAVYGALAAFFIGQGKTRLVSLLAVGTNFVNLFFDMVMIYGIEGYFPSLGITGAAIATSFSNVFQVAVLFSIFFKKENRLRFGTHRWYFRSKAFLQCMRIGIPGGCSGMVEIWGWAAFFEMMTLRGDAFITAAGLFQSFLILLFFVPEGLNKGVIAICGNFIGFKQSHFISKTVRSGQLVMLAFITLLLLGYPFYVDNIIYRFLGEGALTLPSAFIETCYFALLFSLIYIFIDGLRYVYTGVLTAAGDTLFLLLTNFVGIWLFLVIPTYIFVVIFEVSLLQSLTVAVSFSVMMLLAFLLRYRFGSWLKRQII